MITSAKMHYGSICHAPSRAAPLRADQKLAARLTDSLLAALVVYSGLPETLFNDSLKLGPFPLVFVIWYGVVVSILFEFFISRSLSKNWPLRVFAVVGFLALLAIQGIVRHAELKWWLIDTTHYTGLLLGLVWGANRGFAVATNRIIRFGTLGAIMLVVNVSGLAVGLIPAVYSGRTYTYGMFTASYVVMVCLPILLADARFYCTSKFGKQSRLIAGSIVVAFLFVGAQLAVTRSMLILTLFVILLSCWVTIKKSDVVLYYVALFTLVLLAGLLGSQAGILSETQMSDRFTGRNLIEEDRYIEIEMMLEDMESHASWWIGKGFGSRFLSCVVVDGEDLALAPHIAVLTPLYKGGLFCFALMILFPTLQAVYRLTKFRGSRRQLAFSGGLLVYIMASSMSGGWNFLSLFFYGAFWSLSNAKSQVSMS